MWNILVYLKLKITSFSIETHHPPPPPDYDFMDEAGPLRAWYTTMKAHENMQKK